jgi:hypothetical protein
MSPRGDAVSPEEIAISAPSAADGAAIRFQSPGADDPRLRWLNDAWPGLLDDVQAEILKLAGFDPDDDGSAKALPEKAVSP